MTPRPNDALVEPGLSGWPSSLDTRLAYEADYEVLREIWNQYHGLLVARMTSADGPQVDRWTEERSTARDALASVDPRRNDDVHALLAQWSHRVRSLRGQD